MKIPKVEKCCCIPLKPFVLIISILAVFSASLWTFWTLKALDDPEKACQDWGVIMREELRECSVQETIAMKQKLQFALWIVIVNLILSLNMLIGVLKEHSGLLLINIVLLGIGISTFTILSIIIGATFGILYDPMYFFISLANMFILLPIPVGFFIVLNSLRLDFQEKEDQMGYKHVVL